MKIRLLLILIFLSSYPLFAINNTTIYNNRIEILFGLFFWILLSLIMLFYSLYNLKKTGIINWVISTYLSYFSLFSIYLILFWYFLTRYSDEFNDIKLLGFGLNNNFSMNDFSMNYIAQLRELDSKYWTFIYFGFLFLIILTILIVLVRKLQKSHIMNN